MFQNIKALGHGHWRCENSDGTATYGMFWSSSRGVGYEVGVVDFRGGQSWSKTSYRYQGGAIIVESVAGEFVRWTK